jgi:hypothetical protein
MQRRALFGALLVVAVGVALGATVFRTDIAQATGLKKPQSVIVDNTAAQAVPVREQNLDSGNIKVHEQGTANVNVTNGSLSVSQPPVTGGGAFQIMKTGNSDTITPQTASALTVAFRGGATGVSLTYQGSAVAYVAAAGSDETVPVALTRPIQFDRISCFMGTGGGDDSNCLVTWVGAQP